MSVITSIGRAIEDFKNKAEGKNPDYIILPVDKYGQLLIELGYRVGKMFGTEILLDLDRIKSDETTAVKDDSGGKLVIN